MDTRSARFAAPNGLDVRALDEGLATLVLAWAEPGLTALFEALEGELFARADAARSDAGARIWFDAVRILQVEQGVLRLRVTDALRSTPVDPATGDEAPGGSALTLVDERILERRLATAAMSRRAERDFELPLTLLGVRMAVARGRSPASPETGPGGVAWSPRQIAAAWAHGLASLDVDPEVTRTLCDAFEERLLSGYGELCEQLDAWLVDAGILPDLSAAEARALRREGTAGGAEPAPEPRSTPRAVPDVDEPDMPAHAAGTPEPAPEATEPPEDGAVAARSLLQRLPGLGGRRRFSGVGRAEAGAVLSAARVLSGAADAQAHWFRKTDEASLDEVPERLDLAGGVLGHGADPDGLGGLETHDEDVINLLQSLFDRLLAGDELPVPMRALVARIQFPVLRVALTEPDFIVDAAHPVRRFLDTVTRIGIGWMRADERGQDRLYAAIEQAVRTAAAAFEADAALFARLDDELRTALAAEAASVRRASERIIAQERARIAAEHTRMQVERLVDHRVASVADPRLAAFLARDWHQVLLRIHLREGTNSEAWRDAFAVLRRLSGSTGPSGKALHDALRAGLEHLGRQPGTASREAGDVLALWAEGTAEWDPGQSRPESRLALSRRDERESAIERLPHRGAVEQANALRCGDWIELEHASGRRLRCRLASVTEAPERCIFVNRRGVRIETCSRLELASGFETGRIRRIPSGHIVDAALEHVIEDLSED
jgi:hypothetical protein